MVLSNIEPKEVFRFFEEISAIPRGSGNTDAIAEYCVDFAKERGLEYRRDDMNNVIIIKPASAGRENSPSVIIQGHLDMVCEKEDGADHDFEKDGIKLQVEDGYVKAKGTTLGADDGIAVAYALALIDSHDISHPRIEAIFTSDEEIGMLGAAYINLEGLKSNIVLNIDSEEEGIFTAGCAGGAAVYCTVPLNTYSLKGSVYNIKISNLTGGHSGVEINKGRANAAKLAGRVIKNIGADIIKVNSGSKDNAIPASAYISIVSEINPSEICRKMEEDFNREYPAEKGKIKIECSYNGEQEAEVVGFDKVSDFIEEVPNGVQAMSREIDGLVQTSLNLGVLKIENSLIKAAFLVRSSLRKEKTEIIDKLKNITLKYGGTSEVKGDYSPWEYRSNSPLRDLMNKIYIEQYGEKPRIDIIHAGLECGMLSEKIDNLDCISFGPNLLDIHTPRERMDIASVKRVWEFILKVLEQI